MAMNFPNDKDAADLLPECPADVTDQLTRKQYGYYRKALLKAISEVRVMLWPMEQADVELVIKPFRTSLLMFLAAKQGKLRHVPVKPAKTPAPRGKVSVKDVEGDSSLVGARPADSTATPIGPTGPFAPPDPGNPATPGPYPPPAPTIPEIPKAG
ncbi:MAG TPA: hypothetical protein VMZ71_02315 [Gemmataceae bacterium]|nr:hypothetical protein [Gemmataceae bacterium]